MTSRELDAVDCFVDWLQRKIAYEGLTSVTGSWIEAKFCEFHDLESGESDSLDE